MSLKATRDFGEASPSETRDLGLDYSFEGLKDGETITAAAFTLEVVATDSGKTVDAAPNTRKVGVASIENSDKSGRANVVAVQRVAGLLDGNRYRVICRATTSLGQVLELFDHIYSRVAD